MPGRMLNSKLLCACLQCPTLHAGSRPSASQHPPAAAAAAALASSLALVALSSAGAGADLALASSTAGAGAGAGSGSLGFSSRTASQSSAACVEGGVSYGAAEDEVQTRWAC